MSRSSTMVKGLLHVALGVAVGVTLLLMGHLDSHAPLVESSANPAGPPRESGTSVGFAARCRCDGDMPVRLQGRRSRPHLVPGSPQGSAEEIHRLCDALRTATSRAVRRRVAAHVAGRLASASNPLDARVRDDLLDALGEIEDSFSVGKIGWGLARLGPDVALAEALLARLDARQGAPAEQASLLIALGGVARPSDVSALRSFAERADERLLPHAVEAAIRIGGPEATEWAEAIRAEEVPPRLRRALASGRRFAALDRRSP